MINRVYDDEEEWFRSIFANSKKEDAIQNQYEFFVQRMGGPPLYSQRKGEQNSNFMSCGPCGDTVSNISFEIATFAALKFSF